MSGQVRSFNLRLVAKWMLIVGVLAGLIPNNVMGSGDSWRQLGMKRFKQVMGRIAEYTPNQREQEYVPYVELAKILVDVEDHTVISPGLRSILASIEAGPISDHIDYISCWVTSELWVQMKAGDNYDIEYSRFKLTLLKTFVSKVLQTPSVLVLE